MIVSGCGNKQNDTSKNSEVVSGNNADNSVKDETSSNEEVSINGKKYDLSKDCDEILQELMNNMYISDCPFEKGKPIRKKGSVESFDKELGIYVYKNITYQLDKEGEYVETDAKDFDERIMMKMSWLNKTSEKLEDVFQFSITSHELNAPNFEIMTPNGIGFGSTITDLENAGAYKKNDAYAIMYLDGTLVNYTDYSEDVERIQKLNDTEWAQEMKNVYHYNLLATDYRNNFYTMEDKEQMMRLLAEADAYGKLASGEKNTMLMFIYELHNDQVVRISFSIYKQSEYDKEAYALFLKNK